MSHVNKALSCSLRGSSSCFLKFVPYILEVEVSSQHRDLCGVKKLNMQKIWYQYVHYEGHGVCVKLFGLNLY
jgi:hypothetical protein